MTDAAWEIGWTDHCDIADLLFAYAEHFDGNEPEAVAALFTEDASLDYGPEMDPIVGRDQIVQRISAGLDQIFLATSHHISNVRVTPGKEGAAHMTAYVDAWHRYRDGSPDGFLWGRYECEVSKTTGGWRIASLTLRAAGTIDFHRDTMHPIGRRPA